MIEVIETITLVVLGLAALSGVTRILRRGSLPDKVLGADMVTIVVAAAVAVGAGLTGEDTYLDVLIVITAMGFIATITVARFIEKRGTRS